MGHLQWHRWITLTRLLTNPVSGTLSNRKVWRNAPAQARNLNAADTFTTRPTYARRSPARRPSHAEGGPPMLEGVRTSAAMQIRTGPVRILSSFMKSF